MVSTMLEGTPRADRIQFGPIHADYVAFTSINELPQVRTSYGEEALSDLSTAIIHNPEIEHATELKSDDFELLSPIKVGRHDAVSAKRYIRDHADYFQIPKKAQIDTNELVSDGEGGTIISIAGHRRKRAIQTLMQRFAIPAEQVAIAADIRQNISFADAMGMQLRENVYERPAVQDEARAIDLFYRSIKNRDGAAPSIAEFSQQLGYGQTKVRDALAYASLPERIQAYTQDSLLPYSTVRRMKTLADAYTLFYADLKDPVRIAQNVEHELVTFANQMVNMDLSGSTEQRRAKMIDNKSKEIFGQAEYQQEGLFLLESATPQARRATSDRQLSQLAMRVIQHQIDQGAVTSETLQEIIERAQQALLSQQENTTPELFGDTA